MEPSFVLLPKMTGTKQSKSLKKIIIIMIIGVNINKKIIKRIRYIYIYISWIVL
jgi:hypothetical protein